MIAFLLPIRLSSTMKTMSMPDLRIASSSAMTCVAGLDPRAAAEGDDDVAKLALKRAAARELQAAEGVVLHLEQVEPRRRHLGHVGLLDLLVAKLMQPLLPLLEEPRPGVLGLADEDHVGQVAEVIFLDRDPRAARPRRSSRAASAR